MIKVSDLAHDLAARQGLSQEAADRFVELMFKVLHEGLVNDRQVKVKGLGTFKLTRISARESVDVNTGERITIDGRDKISFNPDASLRDFVNRPFAQFETVTINEGVNVDRLVDIYSTNEEQVGNQESEEQEVEKKPAPEPESEPVPKPEPVLMDEDVVSPASSADDAEVHEVVDDRKEEGDGAEECEEDVKIEPISDRQDCLGQEGKEEEGETVLSYETSAAGMQAVGTDLNANHSLRRMVILLSVACMFLFLISAGGFYYTWVQINHRNVVIDSLLRSARQVPATSVSLQKKGNAISPVNKPVDSLPSSTQAKREATHRNAREKYETDIKPQAPASDKESSFSGNAASKNSSDADMDYKLLNSQDVRVRTGAYRIIGVKTVVRVRPGQTIQTISRSHLGPDMECYVEVLNGRKTVSPGDYLKIPALKLKRARERKAL